MDRKNQHAIHGRRKSDGRWELIYPKPVITKRKFLIFRWDDYSYAELGREKAVQIAEPFLSDNSYQDIIILRNNYDPEAYHMYNATLVWQNNKWIGRPSRTHNAYVLT